MAVLEALGREPGVGDGALAGVGGEQRDPTEAHLFRVPLGKGKPKRLTDEPGRHSLAVASPGPLAVRRSVTDEGTTMSLWNEKKRLKTKPSNVAEPPPPLPEVEEATPPPLPEVEEATPPPLPEVEEVEAVAAPPLPTPGEEEAAPPLPTVKALDTSRERHSGLGRMP